MIYIEAVHMVGGERHEHISSVTWRNPSDGTTGSSDRSVVVDWIRNKNGLAKVRGSGGAADATVGVVDGTPPYLRTYADGSWTNNLLSLPRY